MTTTVRARIAGIATAVVVGGVLVPMATSGASAATPLAAPVVIGPVDSSVQLKSVTLAWQPVQGAKSYKIEVGTDEDWADSPTLTTTSVIPQLTLPGWLPHAAYVWRVAASDGSNQGRWSSATPLGTFARGWRTSPAGLSVTTDAHGIPTFRWTPIAAAAAYEVQFSSTATFDDAGPTQTQASPVVQSCLTHRTLITPFLEQASHRSVTAGPCAVTLLRNGSPAFWRVRGLDLLDAGAGDVDTTPAAGEGISHLPPTTAANTADLTECPGTLVASPTAAAPVTPTPTPTPTPTGTAAATPAACASASASPSAGASSAAPAAVSGCGGSSGSAEKSAWSGSSTYTPAFLGTVAGDYRTLPPVQTLPLTSDPANGCTGTAAITCTDFPTIHWNASVDPVTGASATRYRIYVALDDSYSNIQRVVETSALEWTPADSWRDSTALQSYYYVVQPCTDQGCGAVTNAPPSFSKRSPAVVPVGQQLVNGASVLTWHDYADTLSALVSARAGGASQINPSEAAAYHVQVATADDPDFGSSGMVDDVTVDGAPCSPSVGSAPGGGTAVQACAAPATSYAARSGNDVLSYASAAKAYGDGSFLWRVQAVDASGHKLPWSPVGAFVRDTTPPRAAAAPLVNLRVRPLVRVTFSEPVTGVSSASLGLSGVASKVVVLDDTHATVAPMSPLTPGQSYQLLLQPTIRDLSGNSAVSAGPNMSVDPFADDRSAALHYRGTWQTMTSTNALGGTFHSAAGPAVVSTTAYGTGVLLTGCVGPHNGLLRILVDGTLKSSLDTFRSFSGCGIRLARVAGLAKGPHAISIQVTGTKRTASKGTAVSVDAVTALP